MSVSFQPAGDVLEVRTDNRGDHLTKCSVKPNTSLFGLPYAALMLLVALIIGFQYVFNVEVLAVDHASHHL